MTPLTAKDVERWLSTLEAKFESIVAGPIEAEITKLGGEEIGKSVGQKTRNAFDEFIAALSEKLAERLRSDRPVTQEELDFITERIAHNLRVD